MFIFHIQRSLKIQNNIQDSCEIVLKNSGHCRERAATWKLFNYSVTSKTKSNAQKIHIKSYSLKKQPIATGALVEICFALDLRAFSTGHPSVICDQCNFPLSPFSMEAHSKKIATCIQVAIFICETIVIEFMLFIRIFIFNI